MEFSYSVKWKETHIPFDRRMEKYSRYSFLPQHLEIHWFSIINSCVTVLLLTVRTSDKREKRGGEGMGRFALRLTAFDVFLF